jgi:hypothetical protein
LLLQGRLLLPQLFVAPVQLSVLGGSRTHSQLEFSHTLLGGLEAAGKSLGLSGSLPGVLLHVRQSCLQG